jgi:tRNA (Thr-GGU) A37 N-methylase
LGSTIAEVVGRDGRALRVRGLGSLDSTPVLDIKPVVREFLPHIRATA